jgi:hypothetical protein
MFCLQDMEVKYHHAYIDGVDFVFVHNPFFHNVESEIYGGDRTVSSVIFCLLDYVAYL